LRDNIPRRPKAKAHGWWGDRPAIGKSMWLVCLCFRRLAWSENYARRLQTDSTLLDPSSQWLERRRQLPELLAWKNDRSRDHGGGLYSTRKEAPAKTALTPPHAAYHPGRQQNTRPFLLTNNRHTRLKKTGKKKASAWQNVPRYTSSLQPRASWNCWCALQVADIGCRHVN
jgi:hypothetical protein